MGYRLVPSIIDSEEQKRQFERLQNLFVNKFHTTLYVTVQKSPGECLISIPNVRKLGVGRRGFIEINDFITAANQLKEAVWG